MVQYKAHYLYREILTNKYNDRRRAEYKVRIIL